MKKNLQKVLALVLAGTMVMSFAACGNKTTSTSTVASTSTETSSKTDLEAPTVELDETVVAGMDGWTKFENTVHLKVPVYDRGGNSNGVADVVNNDWTKWVQEQFGNAWNIEVEYVPITRSAVLTDYALLAADKNLPTICCEYDYPKMTQWINDGYLDPIDMTEFATVAPTFYENMVNTKCTALCNVSGEDYLVFGSRAYGFSTYTWVTFYRKDWCKAVGYDEFPATISEQIDLYKKIKEAGLCEYPLGGTRVTGAGVDQNHAFRTYPQDEILWATTGDYNIPALSTEAQKGLLKVINEEYNAGLIDPEFYLKESADAQADFVGNKSFTYSCYTSSTIAPIEAFYAENPDAELGIVKSHGLVKDEATNSSSAYRAGLNVGAYTGFSSMASDDEKLAAMMYLEWLIQPENLFTFQWGVEGKNFERDANGNPKAISTEGMGHNSNVDYWMLAEAIKSVGSIELDIAAVSPQNLPQDFYQDLLDNYYGQKEVFDAGYANVDCYFSATIEAEAEYAQTLYSKYEEYRNQLTMCAPEAFDALYDELSQKYLADGYQAVIDERLEKYQAGNSTKLN